MFEVMGMCLLTMFCGNLWLSAFMCLNGFLFMQNGTTIGMSTVVNIFIGIMLYAASKKYFSQQKFTKDMWVILVILIISLIFTITQLLGIDPIHTAINIGTAKIETFTQFRDTIGMFGIKAHAGIFYALCLPILAASGPLWFIPTFLMFIPIWLCQSSGATLAGILSLQFYLFFKRRIWFYFLLIPMILGGIYFMYRDNKGSSGMFTSRLNAWHLGIKTVMAQSPILGYGPDSWRNLTPKKNFQIMGDENFNSVIAEHIEGDRYLPAYYDMRPDKMKELRQMNPMDHHPNFWDDPHNEYIKLFFFYGIAGLIIFGGFTYGLYKGFILAPKTNELIIITAMLLVYFISSLTQFSLSIARLAFLFPILLGAYEANT